MLLDEQTKDIVDKLGMKDIKKENKKSQFPPIKYEKPPHH